MDTTKAITHVSLCAGYGGIDLGLKRAIPSLRTIAFSEIESFACANLVSKMEAGLLDPAPIWTDLKTFPWSEFHGRVDILSGGYPCQPFSAAGKRLGAEDPRHLWPFIAAGIALMRLGACFFENVEGHCSLGLPDVLQDLAGMGYRTTWGIFSASEVGAVHQRKRVFILAHRQCEGLERFHYWDTPAFPSEDWRTNAWTSCQRDAWPSRPGQQQYEWEPPRVVADARHSNGSAWRQRSFQQSESPISKVFGSDGETMGDTTSPRCPRSEDTGADCGDESQGPWREESERDGFLGNAPSERPQERSSRSDHSSIQATECGGGSESDRQAQPSLGRDADGLTHRLDHAVLHISTDNRTDELRLLGNGVVPATAERAFRVLVGELMEEAP